MLQLYKQPMNTGITPLFATEKMFGVKKLMKDNEIRYPGKISDVSTSVWGYFKVCICSILECLFQNKI